MPARSTLRVRRSSRRSATVSVVASTAALAAPGDRLQAGQQLGERERLGEVVVAAGLQAVHAVVDAVPRAEEQHRRGDGGVAERGDQAEAVEAGQHHVDDGRVVAARARQLETGHAVLGDVDGKALLAQAAGDEPGDAAIVFDDEDPHAGGLGLAPQDLLHLLHEGPRPERLLQERLLFVQETEAEDGVVRIAGDEQHAQRGPIRFDLAGEMRARTGRAAPRR